MVVAVAGFQYRYHICRFPVQYTDSIKALHEPSYARNSIPLVKDVACAHFVPSAVLQGTCETGCRWRTAPTLPTLGPKSKQTFRGAGSKTIMDGKPFMGWRVSRMRMMCKGRVDKADINSYHPIRVMQVVYRVVMHIIKNRLQSWLGTRGALEELQNRFQKQRRLGDNLFSLTPCIEIGRERIVPMAGIYLH